MSAPDVRGFSTLQLMQASGGLSLYLARAENGANALLAILDAATRAAHPQFERVSRQALSLSHACLATPLSVEVLPNGSLCVAAPWEPSATLASRLTAGPLAPEDAVQLLQQVSEGLLDAHAHGVFHHGVKAEVVFLAKTPQGLLSKLGGFGLAFAPTLQVLAEHRAPECEDGAGPTPASEVFALGGLLYTAVTGRTLPPAGKFATPQPAQRLLPDGAKHLEAVINQALHTEPSKRFQSVEAFNHALRGLGQTLVPRSRTTSPELPAVTPASLRAPGEEQPGDVLGAYALTQLLGEGSMGRVFEARHTLLGRRAAIKLLRPDQLLQSDLLQRFFQEGRSVNQINHQHIVEIFDFVQEQGPNGLRAVYCVMELLDGQTLGAAQQATPFTVQRAAHVVRQVCDALAAAHAVGVVHRDVKPDNIFLAERNGERDYVKVLDFGVAKQTRPTDAHLGTVDTVDGVIIGTPICMSPEQAAGLTVDHRADIYAVGVVLYTLLAGKLPFDGATFGALAEKIITQPAPPLPKQTPTGEVIPPALASLVLKCLEKNKELRPASMTELSTALHAYEVTAAPKKRSWLVPALLVTTLGAVAVAGFALSKPVDVPPPTRIETVVVPDVAKPLPTPVPVAVPEVVDAGAAVVEAVVDAGAPVVVAPPKPKPVVAARAPGPLTPKEIGAAYEAIKPQLAACFQQHRALLGATGGAVELAVTAAPDGSVDGVKLGNGLDGTPLAGCVDGVTKRLRFPKHDGPTVTMKLKFAYRVE